MNEICRICLTNLKSDTYSNLFTTNAMKTTAEWIMTFTSIQIQENDGYPEHICNVCLQKLNNCVEFKHLAEMSDDCLRQTKPKTDFADEWTGETEEVEKSEELLLEVDYKSVKMEEDLKTKTLKRRKKEQEKICFICNEKLVGDQSFMKNHILNEHFKLVGNIRQLSCSKCTGKVSSYKSFLAHVSKYHRHYKSENGQKRGRSDKFQAAKFTLCTLCGKKISHRSNFRRHVMLHENNRPHECDLCGKRFVRLLELNGHKSIHHSDERNFPCRICEKKFAVRYQLTRHLKASHATNRNHSCDICERAFKTAQELAIHKLIHGPKIFHCQFCERTFALKKYLCQHLRSHSKSARICRACPLQFLKQDAFDAHCLTHNC